MSNPSPEPSGPPPKFWDALPQIIGKLRDEFLLVTLGILILVVAIGVFASGVVDSLGPAFFYLIVILAWLAYLIGRVLDLWVRLRPPAGEPPAPRPASTDQPPLKADIPSASPAFDQRGQAVGGPQTNVGRSEGPILSGQFHGPVTVGPSAEPSFAEVAPPGVDPRDLERLHRALTARFDREELRTLCFRLGVEYDDLRGEGRSAQARELVRYMARQGRLGDLRAAIEQARPGAL